MMKFKALMIFVAFGVLCSGCAGMGVGNDSYSCTGLPQGVSCKSVRDVYEMTNDKENLQVLDADGGLSEQDVSQGVLVPSRKGKKIEPEVVSTVDEHNESPAAPIRTPANIIRIWIAPWVDKEDVLSMGGYLFCELEERTWRVGTSQTSGAKSLHLIKGQKALGKTFNDSKEEKESKNNLKADIKKLYENVRGTPKGEKEER